MRRLLAELAGAGCAIWLVSSTNDWVIRAAAAEMGISADRVAAATAVVRDGRITGALLRVPTGEGKREALRTLWDRIPDIAFGNSIHDATMLRYARTAVAVMPDPELHAIATQQGWRIVANLGDSP